jgi:hypothetical protein
VGVIIVLCDFAENYSFMVQDEAQGLPYESQSSLHHFAVYFRESLLTNFPTPA